MIRFSQTPFLPFLAIFCTFLALEESVMHAAAAAENIFMDVPALANLSAPPATGSCGSSSKKTQNLSAWERGYEQAMSGKRFKVAIRTRSGSLHAELAGCYEYKNSKFSADDVACCMAGFGKGYADLQQVILNSLSQRQPAPDDPQAQSCYRSFGEGRMAADAECDDLQHTKNACRLPNISNDIAHLGCASVGYLAGLAQCPAVKSQQNSLKRALDNGALSTAALPPDRDSTGASNEEELMSRVPANSNAAISPPYGI